MEGQQKHNGKTQQNLVALSLPPTSLENGLFTYGKTSVSKGSLESGYVLKLRNILDLPNEKFNVKGHNLLNNLEKVTNMPKISMSPIPLCQEKITRISFFLILGSIILGSFLA